MPDLEQDLRDLGRELYGTTPDLRAAVGRRLDRPGPAPAPRRRHRRRSTVAAAVTTALIGGTAGAAAASSDVRSQLRRLAHFAGIDVAVRQQATPRPAPDLLLGTPTTLAAAQHAVSFAIRVPNALGRPDRVLRLSDPVGPIVTLVYAPSATLPASKATGTGALLTEFAGSADRAVFQKIISGLRQARETTVGGAPALWVEGPQQLFLIYADLAPRASANSLVWSAAGVTYRLEADLPLTAMRQIAESVP